MNRISWQSIKQFWDITKSTSRWCWIRGSLKLSSGNYKCQYKVLAIVQADIHWDILHNILWGKVRWSPKSVRLMLWAPWMGIVGIVCCCGLKYCKWLKKNKKIGKDLWSIQRKKKHSLIQIQSWVKLILNTVLGIYIFYQCLMKVLSKREWQNLH